jgi:hypothetical protein
MAPCSKYGGDAATAKGTIEIGIEVHSNREAVLWCRLRSELMRTFWQSAHHRLIVELNEGVGSDQAPYHDQCIHDEGDRNGESGEGQWPVACR